MLDDISTFLHSKEFHQLLMVCLPHGLCSGEGPVASALVVLMASILMGPMASALVDEVALSHLAAHCGFQASSSVCAGLWGLCDFVYLFVKPG